MGNSVHASIHPSHHATVVRETESIDSLPHLTFPISISPTTPLKRGFLATVLPKHLEQSKNQNNIHYPYSTIVPTPTYQPKHAETLRHRRQKRSRLDRAQRSTTPSIVRLLSGYFRATRADTDADMVGKNPEIGRHYWQIPRDFMGGP